MRVLVTGASGFVGLHLLNLLTCMNHIVVATVRRANSLPSLLANIETLRVGNVDAHTEWSSGLLGAEAVVHLAARAHILRETEVNALSVFRAINRDGTFHLAKMAAKAGVRRFVFISSVGVNGYQTVASPFTEQDQPNPHNVYAVSKWEAEQGLLEISAKTGMEVVILRPPLAYGPGVKANFLRLMQLVERGWPLPLGTVHNRRSLLYVGNLVSAISHCITHPNAAGKTFLVSDGEDVSTPDLIRLIASEMGKPARLLPVPPGLIRLAASMLGKRKETDRLLGSLTVDCGKLMRECGWQPPYTLQQGLHETVQSYLTRANLNKRAVSQ